MEKKRSKDSGLVLSLDENQDGKDSISLDKQTA
jgi:hypothetical protein